MESRHSQTTILSIKFELLLNSLYSLFLFSLQRLHLLLIIIFKEKRLNNKIIFQKTKLQLTFTLDFVIQEENKSGDPRNGQTLVILESFFPPGRFSQDVFAVLGL